MENNKYMEEEEEEEDECNYAHIYKGDVCPNMGKDLVECRDGQCPHKHLLHGNCQHRWEKSRTDKNPGISFPPVKSRTWFCPLCHPWYSVNSDSEDENPDSDDEPTKMVRRVSEDDEVDGMGNKVEEKQMQKEDEEDEEDEKKRFNKLCQVFESQKLMKHNKIGAKEKRDIVRALTKNNTLEDILSGNTLAQGEELYGRLKILVNASAFKSKPIKDISQLVMKFGKLIHQEHCQEDFCKHCSYLGPSLLRECIPAAANFKELYELSSTYAMHDDAEAMEQQNGQQPNKQAKKRSKELFLPNNASKYHLRFIPTMVSYYH